MNLAIHETICSTIAMDQGIQRALQSSIAKSLVSYMNLDLLMHMPMNCPHLISELWVCEVV